MIITLLSYLQRSERSYEFPQLLTIYMYNSHNCHLAVCLFFAFVLLLLLLLLLLLFWSPGIIVISYSTIVGRLHCFVVLVIPVFLRAQQKGQLQDKTKHKIYKLLKKFIDDKRWGALQIFLTSLPLLPKYVPKDLYSDSLNNNNNDT